MQPDDNYNYVLSIDIDVEGGNNLMYLPLDKIIRQSNTLNNQNNKGRDGSDVDALTDKLKLDRNTFDPRKRQVYEW